MLVNKLNAPQIRKTSVKYRMVILMNEKYIDALEFIKKGFYSLFGFVVL